MRRDSLDDRLSTARLVRSTRVLCSTKSVEKVIGWFNVLECLDTNAVARRIQSVAGR